MATEDNQQGERLRRVLASLKVSQTSFAKRIGVSQGFIGQILSGKSGISATVIEGISSSYKSINLHWLLTGEGEMESPSAHGQSQVNEPQAEYRVGNPADQVFGRAEELMQQLLQENQDIRRRLEALEGKVGT